MSIFGKLVGALLGLPLGPVGILLGIIVGHLVDLMLESRNTGTFGAETTQLTLRLFALWGRIVALGGPVNPLQARFLEHVATQVLRMPAAGARQAYRAFEESLAASLGQPWNQILTDASDLAREIDEDYFLDRRSLIWVYATGRRLAALGTVRPGIVELLDEVARRFRIFEEVGTAGVAGGESQERYEQAWSGFRPASQAGPEAYALLGLTPDASVDAVKKAYRALVRTHHPDAHSHLPDGDPQKKRAAEQFLQVQQAYERIRKDRQF